MPSLGAARAVQDEWFSKPHKRDLVGQSPWMGLRRLRNHSSCAARGLAYDVTDLFSIPDNSALCRSVLSPSLAFTLLKNAK